MNSIFFNQFHNQPVLMSDDQIANLPKVIESVEAFLEQTAGIQSNADVDWWDSYARPYRVQNGILIVPITGTLLHGFSYHTRWATGYEYLTRCVERGLSDGNVQGILLSVNSGGGSVNGIVDLGNLLMSGRGQKPIRAIIDDHAYSAAYWLASCADEIHVSKTGGVGSIGTLSMHVSYQDNIEADGIKITLIHSGTHKVDGNPYKDIPESVVARVQEWCDYFYSLFCEHVASARGISVEAVQATEAKTYMAHEAISLNLVDKIVAVGDALADFSASLNPQTGDFTMADFTQAQLDQAVEAAKKEGLEQGLVTGAAAERSRISAIMALDSAKTRQKAANALAMNSDMTVEKASEFLSLLPEETVQQNPKQTGNQSAFDAAMSNTANPDLSANDSDAKDDQDKVAAEVRNLAKSFGVKGFV